MATPTLIIPVGTRVTTRSEDCIPDGTEGIVVGYFRSDRAWHFVDFGRVVLDPVTEIRRTHEGEDNVFDGHLEKVPNLPGMTGRYVHSKFLQVTSPTYRCRRNHGRVTESMEEFQKGLEDAAAKVQPEGDRSLATVSKSMEIMRAAIDKKRMDVEKAMTDLEKMQIDAVSDDTREYAEERKSILKDKVEALKKEVQTLQKEAGDLKLKSTELAGRERAAG